MIRWKYIFYSEEGASLVELLVVLSAICIIVGVTMPSMRSLGSGITIHTEAIQMAQDIRYTQQLSLSRGKNYMLRLDIEKELYDIKLVDQPTVRAVKRVHFNRDVHVKTCNFRSDGNQRYIEFNGRTGIPGQTGSVELEDNYGNMRKIIVEPTTGRVKVE